MLFPEWAKRLVYVARGRRPWSPGYATYRDDCVARVIANPDQLEAFRDGAQLPARFGVGLDERVIEYPWVVSRLAEKPGRLLDAGAALNHSHLLGHPRLVKKQIVVYTLSPKGEVISPDDTVSYVFGDLRQTILRDDVFDEIVCISTLEHVGLDNSRYYTTNANYRQSNQQDFRLAVQEMRRTLAPGGRLFVTVPFGKPRDLGWLQVFDRDKIQEIVDVFGRDLRHQAYYRYERGWQRVSPEECRESEYHDAHARYPYASGSAAAAGAVACLELVKVS